MGTKFYGTKLRTVIRTKTTSQVYINKVPSDVEGQEEIMSISSWVGAHGILPVAAEQALM